MVHVTEKVRHDEMTEPELARRVRLMLLRDTLPGSGPQPPKLPITGDPSTTAEPSSAENR